jgi:hypothetical protein
VPREGVSHGTRVTRCQPVDVNAVRESGGWQEEEEMNQLLGAHMARVERGHVNPPVTFMVYTQGRRGEGAKGHGGTGAQGHECTCSGYLVSGYIILKHIHRFNTSHSHTATQNRQVSYGQTSPSLSIAQVSHVDQAIKRIKRADALECQSSSVTSTDIAFEELQRVARKITLTFGWLPPRPCK